LNLDKQCLIIYVDFGNSEWVNIKGIRPLHAEFAKLEIQSIAVTLSNVCLYYSKPSFIRYFVYRLFQKKI
jgi:hypothetical protein